MSNYIIKGCGNIDDVTTALKTLKIIYGDGATLLDVAQQQLKIIVNNQLKNIMED